MFLGMARWSPQGSRGGCPRIAGRGSQGVLKTQMGLKIDGPPWGKRRPDTLQTRIFPYFGSQHGAMLAPNTNRIPCLC